MKSLAHRTSAVVFLLRFCAYNTICFLLAGVAHAQTAPDFTIIVLPDTQYYSESYPNILDSQMQWIVANASALNVQAVLGLGDIVNNSGNSTEWTTADAAYKQLDAAHIPYFAAIGNHDYNNTNPSGRTSAATNFNNYFGPSRYRSSYWSSPYWISSFPAGSNENFYGVLTINGQPYLIMALEFYPRDSVLSWAAQVIQSNADKQVIIITHAYQYFDNTRISPCNSFNAQYYGLGADNDGDAMWAKLVQQYSNITMVLSGHEIRGTGQDAAGRRIDLGVNGNMVNQILSNYQNMTNGGNGYLRIMRFHPSSDTIDVSTYSPHLNAFLADANNRFTIPWHKWTGAGNGSVAGLVKDISTCTALTATVSSSAGSQVATSSGNYSFASLAPGTYKITAAYPNYTSISKSIQVAPAMAASGKLYLGTQAGQINGLITDANGVAIGNASVHLTGSASTSGSDETITTGSNGAYSSGPIAAGTYQITASASGYNPSTLTASLASGATLSRNLVLTTSSSPPPPPPNTTPTTGTVIGRVLKDDTTIPLVGATIAYSGGKALTNSTGNYTLSNVPAGSIKITASINGYTSKGQTVAVTAGATASANFALIPKCVAGTVNPSVTMCLPTANSTVLNPVHVIGLTTDSHTVLLTQIWVDGKKVKEVSGNSINVNISMTTGITHRVTVQAVDNINQVFKQAVYVTVH